MHKLKLLIILFTFFLAGCMVPANDLAPVQSVTVHTTQYHHRVIEGEQLHDIAKRYGKSVDYIARVNHMAPPYHIFVGQNLSLESEVLPHLDQNHSQQTYVARAEPQSAPQIQQSKELQLARAEVQIQSLGHNIAPQLAKRSDSQNAIIHIDSENKAEDLAERESSVIIKAPKYAKKHVKKIVRPIVNPVTQPRHSKHKIVKAKSKSKWQADYKQKHFSWVWPAKGKVVGKFSKLSEKAGIEIAGEIGERVQAIEDGEVVYSGAGLRGYGKLVIIKHGNDFLSAYAHNKNLLVREGMKVHKGQQIAEMGKSESDTVMLHFELRHHGKPIDPLTMLPNTQA